MNKQLQIAIGKLIGKDYINTILSTGEELYTNEPTLQDVLLAIPKCTEIYLDLKEGLIFEMGLGRGRIYYDLNLSLFNQTDEVKQQLLELMK